MKQFGEIDPEVFIFLYFIFTFHLIFKKIQEKLKYSKWKAADITLAFKEGRKPVPGPAGGDDFSELDNLEQESASNSVAEPSPPAQFQQTNGNHVNNFYSEPSPTTPVSSAPDQFHFVDFNDISQPYSDPLDGAHGGSLPSSLAQIGEINYSPPSQPKQPTNTQFAPPAQHSPQTNNVSIYPNTLNNNASSQFQQSPNFSQPQQQFTPPQVHTPQQPQYRAPQQSAPPNFTQPPQQYTPPQAHVPQHNQIHTPHQPHFNQSQPQLNQNIQFNHHLQSQSQPIVQGRQYDPETNRQAYRYARFAVSALQFEDVSTAILNIKRSLSILGVHVP